MERFKNLRELLKRLIIKEKFAILLSAVFFFFLIFYWGKFGDPIIDCPREAYIPYSMAYLGKVLFKDVVCIYGPLPYYLNAVIMRLFGPNFNVLFITGAIFTYSMLLALYYLLKRFSDGLLAFLFTFLVIAACVFSPSIFNFIFPYSYATLYGMAFAVFHLVFLVKFIDKKNPKYLYFAAFFLSLMLLSKFDFLPCALVMPLLGFLYRRELNLKNILNILLSFFSPIILFFGILFFQKVTFSDIIFNFRMISNMANAPSLKYFYTNSTGYFPSIRRFFISLPDFLIAILSPLLAFGVSIPVFKIKNRFLKIFSLAFVIVFTAFLMLKLALFNYVFYYLSLAVLFLFSIKIPLILFKKLKNKDFVIDDNNLIILTIIVFSLLASLKSLFGIYIFLYGTFYLPLLLLSFYLIFFSFFDSEKPFCIAPLKAVTSILIILFLICNFSVMNLKNEKITTPAGSFYVFSPVAKPFRDAINFIKNDTRENDSILMLPEGLFLNFAFRRNYPYFNTSFTPLDFDAYGEDYLISSVFSNPPKYLFIIPRDFSEYGKPLFCANYGGYFCSKFNNNYKLQHSFPQNPENARFFVKIFERIN